MNKTLNNLDNHNSRMNTTEGRGKGGLRQALPQNTVTKAGHKDVNSLTVTVDS
jgi:hypothetical protein